MGVKVEVLDPTPDCPAAVVAKQTVGSFRDPVKIRWGMLPNNLMDMRRQWKDFRERWSGWEILALSRVKGLSLAWISTHF